MDQNTLEVVEAQLEVIATALDAIKAVTVLAQSNTSADKSAETTAPTDSQPANPADAVEQNKTA